MISPSLHVVTACFLNTIQIYNFILDISISENLSVKEFLKKNSLEQSYFI